MPDRQGHLVGIYAPHLVGRLLVLAAQTVAELRFGVLLAHWGEARRAGHASADDHHANDLWIAATAVRYRLLLVAHDGVFRHAPGLDLRTEWT